jgi:hypothetical protein
MRAFGHAKCAVRTLGVAYGTTCILTCRRQVPHPHKQETCPSANAHGDGTAKAIVPTSADKLLCSVAVIMTALRIREGAYTNESADTTSTLALQLVEVYDEAKVHGHGVGDGKEGAHEEAGVRLKYVTHVAT